MEKRLLSIAQCLKEHPVSTEKSSYIVKYINILEYFTKRYSKNDLFANEMLNLYKEKLITGESYSYNVVDIRKAAKGATGVKFKGYKLFSYRHILLFDCFLINAFNNVDLAYKIKAEIKELFHSRYHKKIELLFDCLYGEGSSKTFEGLLTQIEGWKINKEYLAKPLKKILITANMSAGKSTLINALIGKRINKTQNDACTSKLHYIFDKPYEDYLSYEWDYELNLNANQEKLMNDNPQNNSNQISVGTFFRTSSNKEKRICIIDTPGVNSSLDREHKDLTYKFIESGDYEDVVCILNATNIGTFDDMSHMKFLVENIKNKRCIFVINQLDKFDKDEDSIDECVEQLKKDLQDVGFENYIVCPISAYAGLIAKKCIYNEPMTEVEKIELQMLKLKFNENESSMQKYFEFKEEIQNKSDCLKLLYQSGIINLEKILFE